MLFSQWCWVPRSHVSWVWWAPSYERGPPRLSSTLISQPLWGLLGAELLSHVPTLVTEAPAWWKDPCTELWAGLSSSLSPKGPTRGPFPPPSFSAGRRAPGEPVKGGRGILCGNVSRLCKQPVTHRIAMSLTRPELEALLAPPPWTQESFLGRSQAPGACRPSQGGGSCGFCRVTVP